MSSFAALERLPGHSAVVRQPPVLAPTHGGELILAILNQLDCGVIHCDDRGVILYANVSAEYELRKSRVLCRGHDGQLREVDDRSGRLSLAVALAAKRGRRGLLSLGSAEDSLPVAVQALSLNWSTAAGVLVILGRRRLCTELGLELLAASYGLTLAERRVLGALLRRSTPREAALEHGVSLTTVRTQIQSLRAKMNVRSVDELFLRLAELPPVASALSVGN